MVFALAVLSLPKEKFESACRLQLHAARLHLKDTQSFTLINCLST
jgi:hypothetical protein